MKTIGIYEAKAQFSALLNEVAAGETVVITKHGSPVARLVPEFDRRAEAARVFRDWMDYRQREGIASDDIDVNELIDEGHD